MKVLEIYPNMTDLTIEFIKEEKVKTDSSTDEILAETHLIKLHTYGNEFFIK